MAASSIAPAQGLRNFSVQRSVLPVTVFRPSIVLPAAGDQIGTAGSPIDPMLDANKAPADGSPAVDAGDGTGNSEANAGVTGAEIVRGPHRLVHARCDLGRVDPAAAAVSIQAPPAS